MVKQDIVNYIRQQLNAGYQIQAIRTYLVNYGYVATDVDEAINFIYNPQQPVQPVQQKSQLEVYIEQQLNIGYKPEEVKNFLLTHGYDQSSVENAFTNLSPKDHKWKQIALIAVLVIFTLGIVGGSLYYILSDDTETTTTTRNILVTTTTTGQTQLTTTIAPATTTTTLSSGGTTTTSTTNPGEITTTTKDSVSSTTTTQITQTSIPTDVTHGPEKATVTEIIKQIEVIGTYDRNEADQYCQKVPKSTYKDICYDTLAKTSADKDYCAKMQSDKKRDSCYASFLTRKDNKDYTVCEYITSAQLKRSCEALRNSKQEQKSQNTPKISDIPSVEMNVNEERTIDLDKYVNLAVVWTVKDSNNINVVIDSSNIAKITPNLNWNGVENIVFEACKDTLCDTKSLQITVNKVAGFTLDPIPDINIMQNGDTEIDLDDTQNTEGVLWSAVETENLVVNINQDENVVFIKVENDYIGTEILQIKGCSGTDCDTVAFNVEVINEPAFEFNSINDVIINKNQVYNQITLSMFVNKEEILFSGESTEHLSINIDQTSTELSISPEQDWTGEEMLTIKACDKDNLCKEESFNVIVI